MVEIVKLEEQMGKIKPDYNKRYNPTILDEKMGNLDNDYEQYISKIKKKGYVRIIGVNSK